MMAMLIIKEAARLSVKTYIICSPTVYLLFDGLFLLYITWPSLSSTYK
jgi:hypothetical protein